MASETVEAAIEEAFRFRGDVTLVLSDGSAVEGFLYNRDVHAPEPYVALMLSATGEDIMLPYARVAQVRLSGKDMANGKMYEAWKRNREGTAIQNPRYRSGPA